MSAPAQEREDVLADNNIYENGWNDTNAYIFGWIMSDGCLVLEGRNKTSYAVRIASNDKDIVGWMHGYMCSGNKIYKSRKNYMIKYRNRDAIEFLMQNRLKERKSLDMEFPSIPDKHLPYFIRGYFEGDGSIILRETKYGTYGQVSFTCGSTRFIEVLQWKLGEFGVVSHIYKDGRDRNQSLYLRITSREMIDRFYNLIYSDVTSVPFLRRKQRKFVKLLSEKPKHTPKYCA